MRVLLASYSLGVLLVTASPQLSRVTQAASVGLILSSVLLMWFWRRGLFTNHSTNHSTNLYARFTLLVCAVSAGSLWHSVSAAWQLESQLPAGADGEVFQLHGYVSGLVRQSGRGWQFEFEILSAERLENVGKDQNADRQAEAFLLARLESSSESGSASDFDFSGKTLLTYYPEDFFYGAVNNDSSSGLRNRQEPDEPRAALEIPSQLRPGTLLDLSARLSSPRGVANPSVYDREAALFRDGILATGSVRSGLEQCHERCTPADNIARGFMVWVQQQRFDLRQRLVANSLNLEYPELIVALGLGDGSLLSGEQWDLLRATGTVHLLVVSGLHIGLASLLVYGLAYAIWCAAVTLQPRWGYKLSRQRFCDLCLLLGAGCFALSTGWGLAVQRALIMLFVAVAGRLLKRRLGATTSLLAAASVVLSVTPLAATAQGFWLSFAAVAALLYTLNSESHGDKSALKRLMGRFAKPQLVIAVALALPLWVLGNPLSLAAPIINFLAIPFLSLALLPVVLLTLVDHLLRDVPSMGLLLLADRLCVWLFSALHYGEGVSPSFESSAALSASGVFAFGLLALAMLIPVAGNSRLLLLAWLGLSVLTHRPASDFLRYGDGDRKGSCSSTAEGLEVYVIDVGQGLAVALRSRCHTLLYDTAASFGAGADRGELIVAPSLRALGVESIDRLVLSHADNDHAGGVAGISAAIPIRSLMLSGAAANYSALTETQRGIAVRCRAGQSWRWDGVDFLVLQPAESSADRSASGNANSCVLKASLGKRSILLSGDIERAQELEIHVGDDRWQADVLIAPHHGSATSSSFPLLKRVNPSRAVVSAAHNNAFGHPHIRVIKRYELLAIDHLSTASAGMVSLVLDDANSAWRVENFRKSEQRYWRPR